ncbi:MAG: hypothetical protein J6Q96_07060 [Bacteroidales bacterium]|nr:hypothetical protein [Bacteroidales bacterium]
MEPLAKLSLYDILTQLISGFLILALFIPIDVFKENSVIEWIFLIIFSYLIGIIYHRSLEWIRSWRLIKWIRSLCDKKKKDEICIFCFWICTIFTRNYKYAIHEASSEKEKVGYKLNIEKCNDVDIKKYYDKYYSAMNKPAYSTISILEAQEAFLRNLTWIVVAYFLCYYFSLFDEQKLFECIFILEPPSMLSSNCLILCVSLVVFLIFILFARYQTQMKVYKAVLDADKYINKEEKANDYRGKSK